MSGEEKLGSSELTVAWLGQRLTHAAGVSDNHKISKCDAQQIGVGQGFLSLIFKCSLTWEPVSDKLPSRVVVKVPTMNTINEHMDDLVQVEEDRKKLEDDMSEIFIPMAHRNECVFYDTFRKDCPVPIPKTYYTREIKKGEQGAIIMDDLSGQSMCVNIADGLRLAQVQSIAKHLAKFHAYALQQNDKQNDIYSVYDMQDKAAFEEFPKMCQTVSKSLVDFNKEWFEGKVEAIEYAFQVDYVYDSMTKSHEELGLPPVLVHGDMWTNNIFFSPDSSKENGGSDEVLSFLDWQVVHKGNLAEDLARVLCSSSNGDVRRGHFDEIIQLYYQTLSANMPNGKAPFSLDDVKRAFRRIQPYATIFFLFGVPMMINSPVIQKDPELAEKRRNAMLERSRDLLDDLIALGKP